LLHIAVLDKSIEKCIEKVYRTATCNKFIYAILIGRNTI
jgi:hypothetical protein